jgi:hypothetical protein
VPSQAGPTRNKKRPPRGPLPDQTARPAWLDERAPPYSDEGLQRNTDPTRKISPPTLPRELGHIVPSSAPGRGTAGRSSSQDALGSGLDAHQYQVSPPVQLPQLPALATHALLDTPGSSNLEPYPGDHSQASALYNGSQGPYINGTYDSLGGAFVPATSLVSPLATRSASDIRSSPNTLSNQDPHSEPLYVAPAISSTASSSFVASISSADLEPYIDDGSFSAPLFPTAQPASPVFTRLQHTNDPHFRPPIDVFAGLAYPRAGIVVPALGRGNRPPSFGLRGRDILDGIESTADDLGELHSGVVQSDLVGQATGLVASSFEATTDDGSYGIGAYEYAATTDPYAHDHATSSARGLGYQARNDYDDYSGGNYVARASSHYRTPSDGSYSTQADVGYLPPSESGYATSVDSYASHDGYSSTVPTPTEITVIPAPAGGLVGVWNDVSDSTNLYDGSLGSSRYMSGVSIGAVRFRASLAYKNSSLGLWLNQ